MKILFRNTAQIGSTPAVVDRQTGDIEINVDRWPELTPLEREMVLLHEVGHYLHNTADEKTADAYALEKLAEKYGPDDAEKFFSTFHNTLRGTASYEERMEKVAFRAADLVDQDTNNEIPKKMIKKKRIARSWAKGSVFQPQKSAQSGSTAVDPLAKLTRQELIFYFYNQMIKKNPALKNIPGDTVINIAKKTADEYIANRKSADIGDRIRVEMLARTQDVINEDKASAGIGGFSMAGFSIVGMVLLVGALVWMLFGKKK